MQKQQQGRWGHSLNGNGHLQQAFCFCFEESSRPVVHILEQFTKQFIKKEEESEHPWLPTLNIVQLDLRGLVERIRGLCLEQSHVFEVLALK